MPGHTALEAVSAATVQQQERGLGRRLGRWGLAGTGSRNAGLQILLGVTLPQTVQADKPVPAGWLYGGMLHIRAVLHLVAHAPKLLQKSAVGKRLADGRVDILTNQGPDGGASFSLRLPLAVLFPFSVRVNDRQAMGYAGFVGNAPDITEVIMERILIFCPVHERHRIKHDVSTVQVGRNHRLIAVPQQTLGKLNANGVSLFRRHLAGGIGVNQVVAQNAALLSPSPLGVPHILEGAGQLAV